MTALLAPNPVFSILANNGLPNSGGQLFTYLAGTSTPATTFTTSSGLIANLNPILLNARGECNLWLTPGVAYKFVMQDNAGNTLWTQDNISGINDVNAISAALTVYEASIAATSGGTLVGWIQQGSGAVSRTVQTKLYESVSLLDYGGSPGALGAVNTTALANAYAVSNQVYIPAGTYTFSVNTPFPANLQIVGAGMVDTTQGAPNNVGTVLQAAGNLFLYSTNNAGGMFPLVRDCTLQSIAGAGALFTYSFNGPVQGVKFERVLFGNATFHVTTSAVNAQIIAPIFTDCRMQGASVASINFGAGVNDLMMSKCYIWNNVGGLYVTGLSQTNSVNQCVFELNTGASILLNTGTGAGTTTGQINTFTIRDTHFEQNGSGTGNPDVALQATSGQDLYGVVFDGCDWFAPSGAQSVRISITNSGGANGNHRVKGGYIVTGTPTFCTVDASMTIEWDAIFQTPVRPNGVFRTAKTISKLGAEVGSSVVTVSVAIPGDATMIDYVVQGNRYYGGSKNHTGYNIGKVFMNQNAGTGTVLTQTTVNNGAGVNQGFAVTIAAGVLTVTNLAAMTNTQSGDITAIFYS